MKIGLISDTHDHFDPRIASIFRGVEHILHAGDVGRPSILLQLEQIAPVTAVVGNTDSFLNLQETEVVEFASKKFLLHHIVNPRSLSEPLRVQLARVTPDVVVFGHTHRACVETVDGTLFINPGYAGRSRFAQPRSVAILDGAAEDLKPEFIPLPDGG